MRLQLLCWSLLALFLTASSIHAQSFEDFDSIQLATLKNAQGMTVKVTNFGATVTSIIVPDRQGKLADVALATTRSRITSTPSTSLTSGPSSDAMATASPRASSALATSTTPWPPTMARIICTEASSASTKWFGP